MADKHCTLDNCTRRHSARGMCSTHYRYWSKDNPLQIKRSIKKREQHGMESSPEYNTWCDVIKRTSNVKRADYVNYGGRGIKMCDRWRQSFVAFYIDMGPRPSNKHSIERKDVNGNYEPSNCIWVTRDVQALNRRVQKNNRSGVVGVRLNNQSGRWYADIRLHRKLIYLGSFENKEQAIAARKAAELKYFQPIIDKANVF